MEPNEQLDQVPQTTQQPSNKNKAVVQLKVDYRIVSIVLLIIVLGMFALWRPWQTSTQTDRTISVTGQATVEAEPDQYTFNPSYEFKDTSKDKALSAMTKKSDEVVAGLKAIGVTDEDIKTNASGYDYPVYYNDSDTTDITYQLFLAVNVDNKELAQKVQDYLITTTPTGSVSPYPNFSEEKQNELEASAQTDAAKDARTKAEQMAKDIGFSLGTVKTITTEQPGGIYPIAMDASVGAAEPSRVTTSTMAVQPGQNEITYTFRIEYYIK